MSHTQIPSNHTHSVCDLLGQRSFEGNLDHTVRILLSMDLLAFYLRFEIVYFYHFIFIKVYFEVFYYDLFV